jgi:hypothetical protein
MELPHWLMAVGALLLVFGFFGLALQKNVRVTSDPDNSDENQSAEAQAAQPSMPNPPSAAAAS